MAKAITRVLTSGDSESLNSRSTSAAPTGPSNAASQKAPTDPR
ncbi:MAG TPA: hypothetical protein VFY82_01220 [Acidimicrobiales bacterium]|nr:hypothetical protein [Acidimicrobiales bacterium]